MDGIVWHNLSATLDIVEYIKDNAYGVVGYGDGVQQGDVPNATWYATMMSMEDVREYIDWCHYVCDREIYNRIQKKIGDKDW